MSELDIQATWVSVLLDIGEMRVKLEEEAKKVGLLFYGDEKINDLQDHRRYLPALQLVLAQHVAFPESWSRLLSYTANNVVFSTNEELRGNLLRLATITTAWIEAIDRQDHLDTGSV